MSVKTLRPHGGQFTWQDVDTLKYKQEGSAPFKDVTRRILFDDADLACQLRYFEVSPGGYTTLERHRHVHAVMVVRGSGRCLVGEEVFAIGLHDLVSVPAMTWHQFHAAADEPLGFLCMVNARRDRPMLPGDEDLQRLRRNPAVAAFIKV